MRAINSRVLERQVLEIAAREIHVVPFEPMSLNGSAGAVQHLNCAPCAAVKLNTVPFATQELHVVERATTELRLFENAIGEGAPADRDTFEIAGVECAADKRAARPTGLLEGCTCKACSVEAAASELRLSQVKTAVCRTVRLTRKPGRRTACTLAPLVVLMKDVLRTHESMAQAVGGEASVSWFSLFSLGASFFDSLAIARISHTVSGAAMRPRTTKL